MNAYEKITEHIIAKIKEDKKLPWHKPWIAGSDAQQNAFSNHIYRGINVLMTWMQGFTCSQWGTYNQIKKAGGNVRKGQKGTPVVYWSIIKKIDAETGKEKKIFFCKASTVFNIEQTEGLEDLLEKIMGTKDEGQISPKSRRAKADKIIKEYKDAPEIKHGGNSACYVPSQDLIKMPLKKNFESIEAYYSTIFHEMVHSTGHEKRLDRLETASFGSHKYSKEELVAELGACFLRKDSGIDKISEMKNSTSYLSGWVSKLEDNPKWLIEASSKAVKAVNLIQNIVVDYDKKDDEETVPAKKKNTKATKTKVA